MIDKVSITITPAMSADLERHETTGVSQRIRQWYERYNAIVKTEAIELTTEEAQVLGNVCSGSLVDNDFIRFLDMEIEDYEEYPDNPVAQELRDKIKAMSFSQRLATVERAGF